LRFCCDDRQFIGVPTVANRRRRSLAHIHTHPCADRYGRKSFLGGVLGFWGGENTDIDSCQSLPTGIFLLFYLLSPSLNVYPLARLGNRLPQTYIYTFT